MNIHRRMCVHPFQGAPASCAVPTDPSVLRMLASPLNEYTSFRLVVTRVQRIGDGTAQVYDHTQDIGSDIPHPRHGIIGDRPPHDRSAS